MSERFEPIEVKSLQAEEFKKRFQKIYFDFLDSFLDKNNSVNPTIDPTTGESRKMVEDIKFIKNIINEFRIGRLFDQQTIDYLDKIVSEVEKNRDNILLVSLLETINQIRSDKPNSVFRGLLSH